MDFLKKKISKIIFYIVIVMLAFVFLFPLLHPLRHIKKHLILKQGFYPILFILEIILMYLTQFRFLDILEIQCGLPV